MKKDYRWISGKDLVSFAQMHEQKEQDWYNNQFHLSSYSGLINDPNGLVYFQGQYYIFIQNCPFSPHHDNKSWLLYTTKDWIHYIYQGITITPSSVFDQNGAFSGNAMVENDQLVFYYTGNVKLDDANRTSYTLKATIDLDKKTVVKEVLFQTNKDFYSGHFRDPMVFKKEQALMMLNGAQTLNKKGVIALFQATNQSAKKWKWVKDLEFSNLNNFSSYMLECPTYLQNQNGEYLLFSGEQNLSFADGGHSVWYVQGKFDQEMNFHPQSTLQKLDYGWDFYAVQTFKNLTNRQILLAWLGNSQSAVVITNQRQWNGQLTVPREFKFKNGKIYQQPIEELKLLREKKLSGVDSFNYENGLVEIISDDVKQNKFSLVIENHQHQQLSIQYAVQTLKINRENVTDPDAENLPSELTLTLPKVSNFRMLVDRSCLEIFVNDGESSISMVFYLDHHQRIKTDLKGVQVFQLQPIKIEWHNELFTNLLLEEK